MRQPSTSPSSALGAPAPSALNREAADLPDASFSSPTQASGATEVVIRPDGLRHGRWETKPWAFYTMGSVVVALAIVYGLWRVGVFRIRRRKP